MADSRVTVDFGAVVANIDRATQGAASKFFLRTGEVLTPIKADASARWPVRSGVSAKGFKLEAKAEAGRLRAALANDVETTSGKDKKPWPVYRHVWSRWTQEARDAEVAKQIADFASTAETAGRKKSSENLSRWRAIRWERNLGRPAPAGFVGRSPWHWLVRKPGQAAAGPLVADLEADMLRLARGQ